MSEKDREASPPKRVAVSKAPPPSPTAVRGGWGHTGIDRKKHDFEGWANGQTSDALRKELNSLESQRAALECEQPQLAKRKDYPVPAFGKPLEKRHAEVSYHIDLVKAELISRGESNLAERAEASGVEDVPLAERTTEAQTLIQTFIRNVEDVTGRKVKRKDIWAAAGYKEATEFQRFQRCDCRTTKAGTEAFKRVLSMDPAAFIRLLDKKSTTS